MYSDSTFRWKNPIFFLDPIPYSLEANFTFVDFFTGKIGDELFHPY
jgi:hypothetical protein